MSRSNFGSPFWCSGAWQELDISVFAGRILRWALWNSILFLLEVWLCGLLLECCVAVFWLMQPDRAAG